eukprot:3800292-Prymnesium_polylepis.1
MNATCQLAICLSSSDHDGANDRPELARRSAVAGARSRGARVQPGRAGARRSRADGQRRARGLLCRRAPLRAQPDGQGR